MIFVRLHRPCHTPFSLSSYLIWDFEFLIWFFLVLVSRQRHSIYNRYQPNASFVCCKFILDNGKHLDMMKSDIRFGNVYFSFFLSFYWCIAWKYCVTILQSCYGVCNVYSESGVFLNMWHSDSERMSRTKTCKYSGNSSILLKRNHKHKLWLWKHS